LKRQIPASSKAREACFTSLISRARARSRLRPSRAFLTELADRQWQAIWPLADDFRAQEKAKRDAVEAERWRAEAEEVELKRLEREHEALQAEAAKAERLERREKVFEAGVDIYHGAGRYFAETFDGPIDDPEAIRSAAIELGFVLTAGERGQMLRFPQPQRD